MKLPFKSSWGMSMNTSLSMNDFGTSVTVSARDTKKNIKLRAREFANFMGCLLPLFLGYKLDFKEVHI